MTNYNFRQQSNGMFCLRILSVESPRLVEGFAGSSSAQRQPPNSTGDEIYPATSSSRNPNANPGIEVLRGVIHLYCKTAPLSSSSSPSPFFSIFPHSSDPLLPADRGTLLFVPAVPNHLSHEDFLRFCGSYVEGSTEIQIIRNDAIEDRYSVLVKFEDQKSADAFYLNLNGRIFTSAEGEACHILFTSSAEITESIEIADTPPSDYTELPTCLVCIERLDQEMTDIISTSCDHSVQCSCISKWANSSCPVCQFCQEHSVKPICSLCETSENLWICVICGFVGCGRANEGHAFGHWKDTQHCFALDLETRRVWDYVGDKYVNRINQSNSDDVSSEMNSYCRSSGEQFESCSYGEDSGISEALSSSKVEAIVDEHNHLLDSVLENQKMYYEALLQNAKEKRARHISEAVESAVGSKIQGIQLEIEKIIKEKNYLAEINENLLKNQNLWREKTKEIEQREIETLRLKDLRINELEEEIRDFTIFVQAQKALDIRGGADDLRGGTLLPVPSPPVSSAKSRRSSRSARKRS